MPYPLAQVIKFKIDCVELIVSDEVFDDLRLVKSQEEIAKLKASLEIAEKVEERIFSEMKSDWSVFSRGPLQTAAL